MIQGELSAESASPWRVLGSASRWGQCVSMPRSHPWLPTRALLKERHVDVLFTRIIASMPLETLSLNLSSVYRVNKPPQRRRTWLMATPLAS